jgi:hypothetical protein
MKFFVAATILGFSAGEAKAVEVSLQSVQHLQTIAVVYSGLEKGSEYFINAMATHKLTTSLQPQVAKL